MMPELKGHRCACVTFSRDKALPGATCDCGHQACFHLSSPDEPASPPPPSAPAGALEQQRRNDEKMAGMMQRIRTLEQQQQQDRHESEQFAMVSRRIDTVEQQQRILQQPSPLILSRLSQLEETVDRNRYELQSELAGSYHHISAVWQLAEDLRRQLSRAGKELEDLRNRHLELLETDEMLEERIEKLEETTPLDNDDEDDDDIAVPAASPVLIPVKSTDRDPTPPSCSLPVLPSSRRQPLSAPPSAPPSTSGQVEAQPGTERGGAWTVHVSLMPSRQRPLPYEKDTNAYKRCLSRGLHRMLAIEGTSGEAFAAAVSRAFGHILGDCDEEWEPLRAKICDARSLEGQTMLRPLDDDAEGDGQELTHPRAYSRAFLRDNCAVCDSHGNLQALYLAPRHRTFSWSTIRGFPVYMDGLESSWDHDQYLDGGEGPSLPPSTGHQDRGRDIDPATRFLRNTPPAATHNMGNKRVASEMHTGSGGVMSCHDDDEEGQRSRAAKSQRLMVS